MASAISETSICNMALGRFGGKRINDISDASPQAQACRDFYYNTRDALLRSHTWSFATGRSSLSESSTTPSFGWGHKFILPTDFLRLNEINEENVLVKDLPTISYSIEGQFLLTDEESIDIIYTKQIDDPTKFDPMFAEAFVLALAVKLLPPLAEDKVAVRDMRQELSMVLSKARLVDKQENGNRNKDRANTWNQGRRQQGWQNA